MTEIVLTIEGMGLALAVFVLFLILGAILYAMHSNTSDKTSDGVVLLGLCILVGIVLAGMFILVDSDKTSATNDAINDFRDRNVDVDRYVDDDYYHNAIDNELQKAQMYNSSITLSDYVRHNTEVPL